jgi:iron complex transport system ATP-binding protein
MGRVDLQALRRSIGHVNPRHPLRSPLTVRDVILTGITGTIELPQHWQPAAADA